MTASAPHLHPEPDIDADAPETQVDTPVDVVQPADLEQPVEFAQPDTAEAGFEEPVDVAQPYTDASQFAQSFNAYDQPGVLELDDQSRTSETYDEGQGELRTESSQRIVGGSLIVLALVWTAWVAWAATKAAGPSFAPDFVRWFAVASGPLALMGLAWLLFGRGSRGEAARFKREVQAMHTESQALHALLHAVGQQIAANRVALADGGAQLIHLSEEAAGRLGTVTRDIDAGAQAMARYADGLDRAAGSARTDIGVLLADLPKAEAQARAMSDMLRTAGIDAHAQAGALEAQIGAMTIRAREADEAAGGASGRLTAHIAQVDSAAASATERMERATAFMSAGIDATLTRAAESVEVVRHGLDEQGNVMLAMVAQSAAAMDRAGAEATQGLAGRVSDVADRIDGLAAQLAAQDAAAASIGHAIDQSLSSMETRLPAFTAHGEDRVAALGEAVTRLDTAVAALLQTIAAGDGQVGDLTDRGAALQTVLAEVGDNLRGALPMALADVEDRTERGRAATAALAPQVAALAESVDAAQARLEAASDAAQLRMEEAARTAQERLEDSERLVARQSAALDTLVTRQDGALQLLLGRLDGGIDTMRAQVDGLDSAVAEADARAEKLVRDTGPQLIESLLRVREAGTQATERAREAIATAIPDAAARLGDAAGAAMHAAILDQVSGQMTALTALTEQAVQAARGASERLTRQMITIGETTANVESRISEAQDRLREDGSEQFSRRVALLIESLNSTAIDVAKILSNDVTDGAWAQYLKGDRGVFTRRAVRLLDMGEAREIVRHYEEEPEFQEQVNRYIHDFEALLRRVLAERDGSPLGVTLLSSDMGKLYVALAQAIERIRA